MCRFCKGTGKYQLLDRLVDCDQCDATPVPCCRCDKKMLCGESPDKSVCNNCFAKIQGGVN